MSQKNAGKVKSVAQNMISDSDMYRMERPHKIEMTSKPQPKSKNHSK